MGSMLFDGARHIVAQSKIDAARITQRSGNAKRAAISSLEAFNQSLSNSKLLDAAGDQVNSIEENLGRNLDAAAYGKLGQRVAAAEQAGQYAASAAAAGVGGSSVDTYNRTMQLSEDMAEEQGDRQVRSMTYDAGQQAGGAISGAVDGMGRDIFAPNLDFTQYVNDHKMGALTKIVGTAATAAATYFGGPSAGMAVQNLMTADQQASNADFAGASRSLTSAVQNGSTGWDTFRAGADETHAGQPWGDSVYAKAKSIFGSIHIH